MQDYDPPLVCPINWVSHEEYEKLAEQRAEQQAGQPMTMKTPPFYDCPYDKDYNPSNEKATTVQ